MTTGGTLSPLGLHLRAVREDERAEGLEEQAREARREAARLRAVAAATEIRDNCAGALTAAEEGEAAAQATYDGAGEAEREALRRVALAEAELESAQDAAALAREAGDEPAILIGRDEHLTSAARILDHERAGLARAEAQRAQARKALDKARQRVREGRQALSTAEQNAQNPVYTDPCSPGGLLDAFARSLAPDLGARLQRAGVAGFGH